MRRPKLDGVRDALAELGTRLDPDAQFEIVGIEAPSGVRDTPLSRAEMMTGAKPFCDPTPYGAQRFSS